MENIFEKRKKRCELAIKLGFTYDRESGEITTPTGRIAIKKTKNGYIMLCFIGEDKKLLYLLSHQFAWYIETKTLVNCIDHIDRDKHNNKILNLRSVTKSENAMNMKGVKGYYSEKKTGKFISLISVNCKKKQLGVFDTEQEARDCYLKNKEKYHKINY